MNFNEQAVGTDGDGGARSGMIISADRPRGLGSTKTGKCVSFFATGHGGEIERVPASLLEGADTAFAEDDFVVSVDTDVFGREQHSSTRPEMPRFSRIGLPEAAATASSGTFWALRAPICSTSA